MFLLLESQVASTVQLIMLWSSMCRRIGKALPKVHKYLLVKVLIMQKEVYDMAIMAL